MSDKFYLLFIGNNYICYTDNRKIISKFESERGVKFKVIKINKSELSNILNDSQYLYTKLEYNKNHDKLYLPQEVNIALDMAGNKFIKIHEIYLEIKKALRFIKFTLEEEKIVLSYLHKLELLSDDLLADESSVTLEECFDIKRILKEIVQLNKRKGG